MHLFAQIAIRIIDTDMIPYPTLPPSCADSCVCVWVWVWVRVIAVHMYSHSVCVGLDSFFPFLLHPLAQSFLFYYSAATAAIKKIGTIGTLGDTVGVIGRGYSRSY